MSSRLTRARVYARKHGIVLPDIRSEQGFRASQLWAEVEQRESEERFEVITSFLPTLVYVMAGAPDSVDYEKRMEVLQPAIRRARATILGISRSTGYIGAELERHVVNLEAQAAEIEHMDWIASDQFSFHEWAYGKKGAA